MDAARDDQLTNLITQNMTKLVESGFECMESLQSVTMEDLQAMGVPLGHAMLLMKYSHRLTGELFTTTNKPLPLPVQWPSGVERDLQLLRKHGFDNPTVLLECGSMENLMQIGISRGHARVFLKAQNRSSLTEVEALVNTVIDPTVIDPSPPATAVAIAPVISVGKKRPHEAIEGVVLPETPATLPTSGVIGTGQKWSLIPPPHRVYSDIPTDFKGHWKYLEYNLADVKCEVIMRWFDCKCLSKGRADHKVVGADRPYSGHNKRCAFLHMILNTYGGGYFTQQQLREVQRQATMAQNGFTLLTLVGFRDEQILNQGKQLRPVCGHSAPWFIRELVDTIQAPMFRLNPVFFQLVPELWSKCPSPTTSTA